MNGSQSVTLPPISSFDSLVRAAEHEHLVRSQHGQWQGQSSLVSGGAGCHMSSMGGLGPALVGTRSGPETAVPTHNYFIASGPGCYSPGSRHRDGGAGAGAGARALPGAAAVSEMRHVGDGRGNIPAPRAGAATAAAAAAGPDSGKTPVSSPTSNDSVAGSAPRAAKPRRKKQCPVCHNFYANLSTHKSSHMLPEHKPHKCPVCARGFTRNNDLLRHRKRHWKDEIIGAGPGIGGAAREVEATAAAAAAAAGLSPGASSASSGSAALADASDRPAGEALSPQQQLRSLHQIKGTFHCPYKSALIALDMETYPGKQRELVFETSECHQTGVFSRCDTFKNHLKALHFEYPPGTKKKDRSSVAGRCKQCGRHFANVGEWLNAHVGKDCGYVYH
ncbi:LAQU0S01e03400g1_1 [Lachancea quebecensis]|uniref:LAQU0S01e03400g1_1 n=1 Tax=Lachancea quebecensis TaxID=1654605 RepID=A0A0P1KL43_9SACH|nr:LAQU0S01e03400g1_1 [Lachancea quebecensis]